MEEKREKIEKTLTLDLFTVTVVGQGVEREEKRGELELLIWDRYL